MSHPEVPGDEIIRCDGEVREKGYAILESAVGLDFCDEIVSEIRRLESGGPPALLPNEFTDPMQVLEGVEADPV